MRIARPSCWPAGPSPRRSFWRQSLGFRVKPGYRLRTVAWSAFASLQLRGTSGLPDLEHVLTDICERLLQVRTTWFESKLPHGDAMPGNASTQGPRIQSCASSSCFQRLQLLASRTLECFTRGGSVLDGATVPASSDCRAARPPDQLGSGVPL